MVGPRMDLDLMDLPSLTVLETAITAAWNVAAISHW